MKVYGDTLSGNCYKVKLALSLLGMQYDWQHVDILKGEARTPEFLELNPNGKVPTIVLDDGRVLYESNAILGYLADNSSLIPADRYAKAQVYQWLFFEQYSHEPYIAVARFIKKYQGMPAERVEEFHNLQPGGHKALAIMEKALQQNDFLVGAEVTIADIALYGYTHVAHEGGFDLAKYPAILAWFDRIRALPNYVDM